MKRGVILLVFLLFLVPTASAVTIDSVSLLLDGEPLNLIGQGITYPVVIEVSGTSSATSMNNFSLTGDLRNLNPQQQQYASFDFQTCSLALDSLGLSTTGEFTCVANMLIRITTNTNPEVTFTVTENQTLETEIPYAFDFSIDTTQPELVSVSTEFQFNNQYVVKDGGATTITFETQDSVGSMAPAGQIAYRIGTNSPDVTSPCSETTCTDISFVTCNSGTTLPIQLLTGSYDSAGNSIQTPSQDFEVLCDGETPQLIDNGDDDFVSVVTPDPIFNQPKAGDTISFSIVVEEDLSVLSAQGNFSTLIDNNDLLAGSCVTLPADNRYNCTWTLADIQEGTHDVYLFIEDIVGNRMVYTGDAEEQTVGIEYTLIVDEFAGESVDTPLFFKPVIAKTPATKGYNRVAIDLALDNGLRYPIFATFQPERTNVVGDVETLFTSTDVFSCTVKDNTGIEFSARKMFSEISVAKSDVDYQIGNRLNFVLDDIDINSMPNTARVSCNVSSIVKSNGKVYANPTSYLVVTDLRFTNIALNGEHVGAKYIDDIQKREERITSGYGRTIGFLNKAMSTLSTICDMTTVLTDVNSAGAAVQAVGVILEQATVTRPVGEPLNEAGNQVQVLLKPLIDTLVEDKTQLGEALAKVSVRNVFPSYKSRRKSCSGCSSILFRWWSKP